MPTFLTTITNIQVMEDGSLRAVMLPNVITVEDDKSKWTHCSVYIKKYYEILVRMERKKCGGFREAAEDHVHNTILYMLSNDMHFINQNTFFKYFYKNCDGQRGKFIRRIDNGVKYEDKINVLFHQNHPSQPDKNLEYKELKKLFFDGATKKEAKLLQDLIENEGNIIRKGFNGFGDSKKGQGQKRKTELLYTAREVENLRFNTLLRALNNVYPYDLSNIGLRERRGLLKVEINRIKSGQI